MTDLEKELSSANRLLRNTVTEQSKQISSLSENVKTLLAKVEELIQKQKMPKSEKRPRPSGDASSRKADKKASNNTNKSKEKAKSSNSLPWPNDIKTETIVVDLPADEKVDPITGKPYSEMPDKVTEYLTFEKKFKKVIIIQKVYGMGKDLGVAQMDLPENLMKNCKADASLLAHIMTERFLEHRPFYRQAASFAREDFPITAQSLYSWHYQLADALKPLHKELKKWMLEQNSLHVDETFVKRREEEAQTLKNGYMFFLAARVEEIAHATVPPARTKDCVLPDEQAVYMEYFANRDHQNAIDLVDGFGGRLHSDCFKAYEKMADDKQVTWGPCLTHARRKFIQAPDSPIAQDFIKKLGKIIHEDNELWRFDSKKRLRERQKKIKPQMNAVISKLKELRKDLKVDICQKLSLAFDYILKREEHFKNFLDHADLMVDNNVAERAIRPVKIGQNNWLFIGSDKGGESSAIMYSFLLTCKNLGVHPHSWLTNVIRNLPYTSVEDLHTLLPQNWKPSVNEKSPFLPAGYKC